MSAGFTTERRQTPRVGVGGGIECRLDLRTRVRVMDISLGGVLLGAEVALLPGASAQLRSGLGAGTLRADLQVRRTAALQPGVPLKGLGAMFTGMDEQSRRSLEDFLRKASQ
jgi:PilZ domain-containing protein